MTPPFPPGSPVAAYLRDSGGDDQDLSIDQQEIAVRAFCTANCLTLSKIFRDDHISGSSTDKRDGFEEMIRFFHAKPPPAESGVILWKFSRFARSLDDSQFFKADLRRRGIIIHSLQDNIPDGLDGHFFEAAIDWMNARFLKDLSEDVRRGLHYNVSQFGAVPGIPPKGFRRELVTIGNRLDGRPHEVSRWVPDADTWMLCKRAWQMRAAGASFYQIHKETQLYGSLSAYTHFFQNRIYIGELVYGSALIRDYCEPMVDGETWARVQEIELPGRRGPDRHPRRVGSTYLLSGLAVCSRCGKMLSGMSVQPKKKKANHYYICNGSHRHTCDAPLIPRLALDAAVIAEARDHILEVAQMDSIQAELKERHAEHDTDLVKELAAKKRELARISKGVRNITDALAVRGQSAALLEKLDALESSRLKVSGEIRELEGRIAAGTPVDPDILKVLVDQIRLTLESEDVRTVRGALQLFIQRVEVERVDGKIVGKIWFFIPDGYVYGKSHRSGSLHTHNLLIDHPVKILPAARAPLHPAVLDQLP